MTDPKLAQSVERLRNEIETDTTLSPETRQEMIGVLESMSAALADNPDLASEEHQSLLRQFKDAVWQFEKSHPTLTVVLGRVMDDLGRMGI